MRGFVHIRRKSILLLLWAVWCVFCGWCVSGYPPGVDLPAHGAQLQTLVEWVKGNAPIRENFEVIPSLGYGLVFWVFLPMAYLTNGAVAVRVALWMILSIFPGSVLSLSRAWGRPDWTVALSLPLAFGMPYWYGYLPALFAQPIMLFAVSAYFKSIQSVGRNAFRWLLLANLLGTLTLLSHLLTFALLCFWVGMGALFTRPFRTAFKRALAGLAFPLALSASRVWQLAFRAVRTGDWPATEYNVMSHLNWFFKNYGPEGRLSVLGPLFVSLVLLAAYLRFRRFEPLAPVGIFLSLLALYGVTPKTLSGIFLVSVRLPVLIGIAVLLVVDVDRLANTLKGGLLMVTLCSLIETGMFHYRFKRAIFGLGTIIRNASPGRLGYIPLNGNQILGSRHIYLEHLGQWMTATLGGIDHNFFADDEHHPIQYRPGKARPTDLIHASREQIDAFGFDRLLTFGEGPLPQSFVGWRPTLQAGPWRLFKNP